MRLLLKGYWRVFDRYPKSNRYFRFRGGWLEFPTSYDLYYSDGTRLWYYYEPQRKWTMSLTPDFRDSALDGFLIRHGAVKVNECERLLRGYPDPPRAGLFTRIIERLWLCNY
jgi:hypothetical protein